VVQILAEELGIAPEDVIVHAPDTDVAAFDGGAQGSRTVFNAGNAVRRAANDVRERVLDHAADLIEAAPEDLVLEDGGVAVRGAPQRRVTLAEVAAAALERGGPVTASRSSVSVPVPVDPRSMTGAFFTHLNAPTFHVHLAEVEVDPATGHVEVVRYVVAQDVGRAINPSAIEGQVHGGVAQGIGYALYEHIHLADGHVLEHDLEGYRLPGAADVPRIETLLLEHPHPDGPHGAKGAGEPPVVPVAAAIANAVSDAIGRPIRRLPITPFDVLAAIEGRDPEGAHA
jgi:CO/xanthine dehydrogenase Mo-binding subunit